MEYLKDRRLLRGLYCLLSLPFIWGILPCLFVMDIIMEIYHRVCFSLYSLDYIKRSSYIRVDRQKISFLKNWQKVNCMYCGYATGLFSYWVAIAAQTEKYWCGIQHKKSKDFITPKYQKDFALYNNKKDFDQKYKK